MLPERQNAFIDVAGNILLTLCKQAPALGYRSDEGKWHVSSLTYVRAREKPGEGHSNDGHAQRSPQPLPPKHLQVTKLPHAQAEIPIQNQTVQFMLIHN